MEPRERLGCTGRPEARSREEEGESWEAQSSRWAFNKSLCREVGGGQDWSGGWDLRQAGRGRAGALGGGNLRALLADCVCFLSDLWGKNTSYQLNESCDHSEHRKECEADLSYYLTLW